MIEYRLPTSVMVNGTEREIRSDYRAILDSISALNDPELTNDDKAFAVVGIFYVDDIDLADYPAAVEECFKFIDYGVDVKTEKRAPKLIDWEQDFKYIISPINKSAGRDIRSDEYVHWWTFLSWFYEIGECTLSQIVHIRDAQRRGKMDKADREWYAKNRELVDFRTTYTEAEQNLLAEWGV